MLMLIFHLLVLRDLFKKLLFVAVETAIQSICCSCYFWHGNSIAAEFVRQLLKLSLIQYHSSLVDKNGPGGWRSFTQ